MNRTIYDDCSFKQACKMSTDPSEYVLDVSKYERCNKCRPDLGIVGGIAVSHVNGNLVDLENNLFGIDRPSTQCVDFKHQPTSDTQPITSKFMYKTNQSTSIDPSKQHLESCTFKSYPEVKPPHQKKYFQC